jgi:hypothetical protein
LGGIPSSEVGPATLVEILRKLVFNYEGPIIKLVRKYLTNITSEERSK